MTVDQKLWSVYGKKGLKILKKSTRARNSSNPGPPTIIKDFLYGCICWYWVRVHWVQIATVILQSLNLKQRPLPFEISLAERAGIASLTALARAVPLKTCAFCVCNSCWAIRRSPLVFLRQRSRSHTGCCIVPEIAKLGYSESVLTVKLWVNIRFTLPSLMLHEECLDEGGAPESTRY